MRVLVTGGCGFLGTNIADALLRRGDEVRILEDLSRPGSERNLGWLERHDDRGRLEVVEGGVPDALVVSEATEGCDAIVHLAAQVAVTASTEDPRRDFEVNAGGTLNVLEAARASRDRPSVVFASTNKVYGGMERVRVEETEDRYRYAERPHGISEEEPLDFHSPYGCSKGAADQYVRDYARVFGIRSVVFRMSCVYGPHQFGNEDQGWIAHFLIKALEGSGVSVYGDGKQVRDALYVDDAVRAYLLAIDRIDAVAGRVLNLGGGPANTISILELLAVLEEMLGVTIDRRHGDWRPGDQRIYVSDVREAARALNWEPTIGVREGVRRLAEWIAESDGFSVVNRPLPRRALAGA